MALFLFAFCIGIAKIVDDNYTAAAVEQLHAGVGTDVSGTAGNRYIRDQTS